ncbi:hypothetical protein [Microbulbifer sp. TRSA005]|uniref:hypothetical protein n=1 Tax=unclassified Microbulbifer TaxID=2619833 RepID=UPI00403944CC
MTLDLGAEIVLDSFFLPFTGCLVSLSKVFFMILIFRLLPTDYWPAVERLFFLGFGSL